MTRDLRPPGARGARGGGQGGGGGVICLLAVVIWPLTMHPLHPFGDGVHTILIPSPSIGTPRTCATFRRSLLFSHVLHSLKKVLTS